MAVPGRILITGANGHLGRKLIGSLLPRYPIRAVVRSARARGVLADFETSPGFEILELDYGDSRALTDAVSGCGHVVHLAGIIKETSRGDYEKAHQATCVALVQACRRHPVKRIVYLSILGSDPGSPNRCLSSKGEAQQILLAGETPVTVLKVPMVLGEGDYASAALRKRAASAVVFTIGKQSLEQPVYAGDVIKAITGAFGIDSGSQVLDLAGPESLTRVRLIELAARVMSRNPLCISIPVSLGMIFAGLMEMLMPSPPLTRDMLGVLCHDDCIDPSPACETLGIRLTPLVEMLQRVLTPEH